MVVNYCFFTPLSNVSTADKISSTVPIAQISDQARPLLGRACTRLVPDRVRWCMVE